MARWSPRAMTIAKAICSSAGPGDRRSGRGGRGRTRSAQPFDAEAGRGQPTSSPRSWSFPHTDFYERGEHVVELGAARGARRDQAGDFHLRLPHDPGAADQPRADALLRRPHQGSARPGRHSVDLRHPRLHGRRRARARARAFWSSPTTDKPEGDALAERLGRELYAIREQDGDGDARAPTPRIDQGLALHAADPGKSGRASPTSGTIRAAASPETAPRPRPAAGDAACTGSASQRSGTRSP